MANKLIEKGIPISLGICIPYSYVCISSPFTHWNVFRFCKFACLFIFDGFGYPDLNKGLKYKQTLWKGILISLGGIICTFSVSPRIQRILVFSLVSFHFI